jgi:hypothetical protein
MKPALVVMLLAGCFPPGTATNDMGPTGFGTPTLLVTVGGTRIGPAMPDVGSGADLVDDVDPVTGRTTRSVITIDARSTSGGSSCQLYAERLGDGVLGFFATAYRLAATTGSLTENGAASPGAGERVVVSNNGFNCSGSGCDGAVLSFSALSANHVEGYLSGTFESDTGSGAVDIICSFYLPTRTFRR